jgi:DNA-binding beta-propeller fold protein YncE
MMRLRMTALCGVTLASALALVAETGLARAAMPDPNSAPDPYVKQENWAKLPPGRKWGMTIGVNVDRDGTHLWTFDRCGKRDCVGSSDNPIQEWDSNGNLVRAFGSGMFIYPHGLYIDADDNVWVSDGRGQDGKGQTVMKFSHDGKLLMTLGTPGVAGTDATHFNGPSDILIAPNGDIFVADGHGGDTNGRIVKFDKNGKFLTAWGKPGAAPGDFNQPHSLAMDSAGRLFVADRANSRIQIFGQDGKLLAIWKQFGRPSGLWIDKNDMIYVADSTSTEKTNPGFGQGIRIGSVNDGKVVAYIPETKELGSLEGVTADDSGVIYGGYTGSQNLRRFVKK